MKIKVSYDGKRFPALLRLWIHDAPHRHRIAWPLLTRPSCRLRMRCLQTERLMAPRKTFDRDLCGNCDRWREEHYAADGSWLAEQPCDEYYGITPSADRAKKKERELEKALDPGAASS